MKNDDFLKGILDRMIEVVELQTKMGTKLQQLEREVKGVQDACADIHEAVTTRWEK